MDQPGVDPQSGYCAANNIYYSKHPPCVIPPTPSDFITFFFAQQFGDQVAVVDDKAGQALTYAELEQMVQVVAAGLWQNLRLQKSDVVCIIAPNSIEFLVMFLAVGSLGGIVTTRNLLNTSEEIKKMVKDSGTKFIVTVPQLLERTIAMDLPVIIIGDQEIKSHIGGKPVLRYSDLLVGNPSAIPRVQCKQDDTLTILYSSGTTGASKGVVLTHGNFIASVTMLGSGPNPQDWNGVILTVIPMFHIFGLQVCLAGVYSGNKVVILPRFDFLEMLGAIEKHRVTFVPLVPPILLAMIKQDVVLKYDTSSLSKIGSGGAPLGADLLDQFSQRFPNASLAQGYGMTESSGAGTSIPPDVSGLADHYGSAGILLPSVEAMVVDITTSKPLPPNQQGELWIRGVMVMKEYLGNPQATGETVDKDGWLHTGDLVYFDNDGYLYIVDRLKELIKYNALQVAPAELESVLLSHPGVMDCAVIPYPDERTGEIPMAYIVKAAGSLLTADEIMKFVAEKVATYKKIRKVAFTDVIPKSPAGKVQRRELVQLSRAHAKL